MACSNHSSLLFSNIVLQMWVLKKDNSRVTRARKTYRKLPTWLEALEGNGDVRLTGESKRVIRKKHLPFTGGEEDGYII